jgi:hypothetical protein
MARQPILIPLVTVTLALAVACSSSEGVSADASPATDARAAADAAGTSCGGDLARLMVSAEGGCNTLPFPAPRLPFTVGSGSAPSFTGGALVDGLYAATRAEGWNVSNGTGRQMGLVLGNGGKTLLWFGQILDADGNGDLESGTAVGWLRGNYDLEVGANTLDLTATCQTGSGAQAPAQLLYTAVPGNPPQLLLGSAQGQSVSLTTYTWQGCAP